MSHSRRDSRSMTSCRRLTALAALTTPTSIRRRSVRASSHRSTACSRVKASNGIPNRIWRVVDGAATSLVTLHLLGLGGDDCRPGPLPRVEQPAQLVRPALVVDERGRAEPVEPGSL